MRTAVVPAGPSAGKFCFAMVAPIMTLTAASSTDGMGGSRRQGGGHVP